FILMQFVWLLLLAAATTATAKPTDIPATTTGNDGHTHIVSFVNAKRAGTPRKEFDFERNEAEATNSVHVQQLFASLLQLQGPGPDSSNSSNFDTDDAPVSERNTLDDELSLDADVASEQHESSTETADAWNRVKLAIPVLEPVKHLLNAVGGGDVNDTHVLRNSHRLIGHSGVHHAPHHSNGNASSPAIETEEDRETAIDSTGFDLLETLGTAGTVIWGMLQNLRKLFAASAGNASTAFSGGAGGGGG
ncbi:hypothetical protein KR222_001798, partial [Zaprionus bogoriensis]